jgi:hypothetical protein
MLRKIFVVLAVVWLLGVVTSYPFGGFLQVVLLLALAVVGTHLSQRRVRPPV